MTDAMPVTGQISHMWGKSPYKYPGKYLGTGNRCGHDPAKPEFHLFTKPKWFDQMPHAIRKLMDAAQAYYSAPLETLPSLGNLNGRRNNSGDPRQNRSEARAAEVLVMKAIFNLTDFASLRVGTPKGDGGFIPRSCTEIATLAGLIVKTSGPDSQIEPSRRFERAFQRLRKAGAFDVHLQYEVKPDGSKRARPAIKRLNENFLVALGAISYEALKRFRDHCSNQLKAKRRKYREEFPTASDAAKARKQLQREQGDSGVRTFALGNRERRKKAANSARDDYQQAYLAFQAELWKRNPEMTSRDASMLARKQFPTYTEWERDRLIE